MKWVGYSNKDNTWEPAINFIGSVAKSMLNSYLKSNGLDHDGSGSATEPDDSATIPDDSATIPDDSATIPDNGSGSATESDDESSSSSGTIRNKFRFI